MKRRRRVGEPSQFVSIDENRSPQDATTPAIDVIDDARPADQRLIDAWIDNRLRKALQTLSPSHRIIIVLREIEGLSTREVATITGISEANVKTRLHRARTTLRRQLEGL